VNINRSQSYSPSYTANYAEAQSADSKAKTKVTVKADLGQSEKLQIQVVRTPSENSLGAHLNVKA
jgi:flagellar hook protein FlgE